MPDIPRIQQELLAAGIDGWLLYDFLNRDAIAYHVLGLDFGKHAKRRWFYWIPAVGETVRLCSTVEPARLDALPGEKRLYMSWRELHTQLQNILGSARRIAMQYSPLANIPTVSTVDGGTVDLIRSLGYEIVSSANLVQTFQAVMGEEAYHSHRAAGEQVQTIKDEAFALIGAELRAARAVTTLDVQQFILRRFSEEGLTTAGDQPMVGANEQPADPHFDLTPANAHQIRPGDKVLIDLWAKLDRPGAVFYDITWCAFVGPNPPVKYTEIFHIVRDARNTALAYIRSQFAVGTPVAGWQVDDVCRGVIARAGYKEYFVHRTGHSIGQAIHDNGANLDNLETRDERELVAGICFSIEPGIYLPGEMAVRSEINVFITPGGQVEVYGPQQQELVLIDAP
ncbi:MAG: M24 family metallopeptidase [Chloroflexi bacterium]|nr:M24 family metallopeptidase [Chloroflexota bacterium]